MLPDGREAVIKLQRPNIRNRMTTDLRILHRLARTAREARRPSPRTPTRVAIIEDLHAVTFSELNPAVEAYRQDRFRAAIWAFGDNRAHHRPGGVLGLLRAAHDLHGADGRACRWTSSRRSGEMGVDGELVLRRGAKAWLEAVAVHGPFHGDMHAGNIWVLDDGRATFLDFGIMGELDAEWKQVVKDLFHTVLIDQDWARVARAYKRVGVLTDDVGTDDEIGMRLGMLMGPMLAGNVGDLNIGELINMSVSDGRAVRGPGAEGTGALRQADPLHRALREGPGARLRHAPRPLPHQEHLPGGGGQEGGRAGHGVPGLTSSRVRGPGWPTPIEPVPPIPIRGPRRRRRVPAGSRLPDPMPGHPRPAPCRCQRGPGRTRRHRRARPRPMRFLVLE